MFGLRGLVTTVGMGLALSMVGCAADDADDAAPVDEEVAKSEDAVTNGALNWVVANSLHLRAWNSTAGSVIGTMYTCQRFHVHAVDWNTRMAYGYSYALGRWGWARISQGSNVYLTAAGCYSGGGEG